MTNNKRTDEHRPSAIIPSDYRYIAMEAVRVEGIGDAMFIQAERQLIKADIARTGGHYSTHEHGGNCMVCGCPRAVYTILFHHAKSNTYVRMGTTCAQKCEMSIGGGMNVFMRHVKDARKAIAGKRKAKAMLDDAGLSTAWGIYETDWVSGSSSDPLPREERIIQDIVHNVVKYGRLSTPQQKYLGNLTYTIGNRAAIQAMRTIEEDAAEAIPEGRQVITGTVISTKYQESEFGETFKMLLKDDRGFKIFVTVPVAIDGLQRGDRVSLTATLKRSNDSSKFGFGSRPSKASTLEVEVAV